MREALPTNSNPAPPPADQNLAILAPAPIRSKQAYVDFVFGLDYLSLNSSLLKLMHEAMSSYGLSCLLVNHTSVEKTIRETANGSLKPIVYLDLCSKPGDIYVKLLETMTAAGVHTICDPKLLPWTYKAIMHPVLEKEGLPAPATVILKSTDSDRELTPAEREKVGQKCVIKPSFGVGGQGAVVNIEPTLANISKCRDFNRNDDWLIQRMASWTQFGERQAYLRAYNILGYRTLMWWSNHGGYEILTWQDFHKYNLLGAMQIVDRITQLTGVEYFSSEIAIATEDPADPNRYVIIDYVNDQCDIDPQADPDRSPPESWIRWICQRFAEYTWRMKNGLGPIAPGTLYLADAE